MSPGGPLSPGGPQRPMPKSLHSNTIVPNKSTMVEDDDDEMDDEDDFALDNVVAGLARRDTNLNGDAEADQDKIRAQEVEIAELREKLLEREQEILKAKSAGSNDLGALRDELEQKHMDAQKLNDNLREQLDQLHQEKNQDERDIRAQHERGLEDLRAQLNNAHSQTDDLYRQLDTHQAENEELRRQLQEGPQHTTSDSEYERRIELLQQELLNQQKLTKEVRDEATMLLQEMRDLSQQNDEAIEQEEKLAAQVSKLEKEIDEWRQRYARLKAQNKSLRASQMGLGLQTSFDASALFRKDGAMSEGGLVKDVDVTRYQMSVEELLRVARQSSTGAMLDSVKNVVVCVQSITAAIGTDGYPTPSASPLTSEHGAQAPMSVAKLKARVTGTANSLITQTKLHANAAGLSPVALLDAAASNLTAAVVELIKAVGIRASPKSELEDIEIAEPHDPHESMGSFYDDHASQSDDPDATPLAVQVTAPNDKPLPSPLGLGRSNTLKKMNGWFNWGSKTPVEDPPPTPHGLDSNEYDPYR